MYFLRPFVSIVALTTVLFTSLSAQSPQPSPPMLGEILPLRSRFLRTWLAVKYSAIVSLLTRPIGRESQNTLVPKVDFFIEPELNRRGNPWYFTAS